MRNPKFVRYSAVLLGLVVLRTKARNRFCPMCTKGYYIVPTRPNPFWGQFWGQICKTDSHTHRSNKRAALVPLRNADTNITRFLHRKSPTNRYISFTLRQEVVRKHCSTQSPHQCPCNREKHACLGAFAPHRRDSRPAKYHPKIPAFRGFLFYRNGIYLDGISLYR